MAVGSLLVIPRYQVLDANGAPYAGAKLALYLAGTSTPASSYSDVTLTTPNPNPVVADIAGRFGPIYVDPLVALKVVLLTAADVVVFTQDHIVVGPPALQVLSQTGDYPVTTADGIEVLVLVNATTGAATITLPTAVGNRQRITVKKTDASPNAVTLDGAGAETIDGATTYALEDQHAFVTVISDGANWQIAATSSLQSAVTSWTPIVFTPLDHAPPASSYATPDVRNAHPVLDFDASADEAAHFPGVLPTLYAGGGLTVDLYWTATSATSGDVVWAVSVERHDAAGLDLDSDSFAAAKTATATAPGTSGVQPAKTSITFTAGAEMDGLAAGESFRLRVQRLGTNGSDTMTGDAELHRVVVRETPS